MECAREGIAPSFSPQKKAQDIPTISTEEEAKAVLNFKVTKDTNRNLDRFMGIFMNRPVPQYDLKDNEVALVWTMRTCGGDLSKIMKIETQYAFGQIPVDFIITGNSTAEAQHKCSVTSALPRR